MSLKSAQDKEFTQKRTQKSDFTPKSEGKKGTLLNKVLKKATSLKKNTKKQQLKKVNSLKKLLRNELKLGQIFFLKDQMRYIMPPSLNQALRFCGFCCSVSVTLIKKGERNKKIVNIFIFQDCDTQNFQKLFLYLPKVQKRIDPLCIGIVQSFFVFEN